MLGCCCTSPCSFSKAAIGESIKLHAFTPLVDIQASPQQLERATQPPAATDAAASSSDAGHGASAAAAAAALAARFRRHLPVPSSVLQSEHFADLLAFRVAYASLQVQDVLSSSSSSSSSSSASTAASQSQQQQQGDIASHSALLAALSVSYAESEVLQQCRGHDFMNHDLGMRRLADSFNDALGFLKAMLLEYDSAPT
jgi:hypothetical protein